MSASERRSAALDAIMNLDPESRGGIYLLNIAEWAVESDESFLRRQAVIDRARVFIGLQKRQSNFSLRYLPLIKPVVDKLVAEGLIECSLEPVTEFENGESLNRNIYRYINEPNDN